MSFDPFDGRTYTVRWVEDGVEHVGTFRWPEGVRLADGSRAPERERRLVFAGVERG